MTLSSSFHIPGAFHADGVHSGVFRPPVSPASASGYLPGAVDSTPKRKRTRGDLASSRLQETGHQREGFGHGAIADPHLDTTVQAQAEPRFYTLAGQLDSPSMSATAGHAIDGGLGESMFSDCDYRRALGSKRPRDDVDAGNTNATLFRLPDQPSPTRGWGTAAFSTLGGVVGKVWEFCKAGAFKGFYAGEGRGFEMGSGAIGSIGEDSSMFGHEPDEYDTYEHRIPGRFPQAADNYFLYRDDMHESPVKGGSGASTPTAPAAKRRQTDQADDLGRNWVIVTEPRNNNHNNSSADKKTSRYSSSSYRPSPRNRNHGPSMATGRRISAPNTRPGASTPGSTPRRVNPNRFTTYTANAAPTHSSRPSSSASFASPRSPASPSKPAAARHTAASAAMATTASPSYSHSPRGQGHSRRRSSNAAQHSSNTPSMTHRRTNSAASAASSRGHPDEVDASPRLDAEALHLAARRKMEERDADVRIAAFNKRLQDMIRQGKEALGTTIEVDGDDTGWEDE